MKQDRKNMIEQAIRWHRPGTKHVLFANGGDIYISDSSRLNAFRLCNEACILERGLRWAKDV